MRAEPSRPGSGRARTTRWYFRRSTRMATSLQSILRKGSSREHGPDADGDEADAGDELEGLRPDEALELRADEDADAGGEDEGAGGAGEDDPFVGVALGREEEGGELGLVADLREEDGGEDGGEGFPHRGASLTAISAPPGPLAAAVDSMRERPYGVGSRARSSVVEQLAFNQLVVGSIPTGLTKTRLRSPSSRGPGHRPFTAATRVRIPLGTPGAACEVVAVLAVARLEIDQRESVGRANALPRLNENGGSVRR